MKKSYLLLWVLTVAMLSACGAHKTKSDNASSGKADTAAEEIAGEIIGTPAKGSKFAKLKIGMKLAEVVSLIGAPNHQSTRVTGKTHIPFYFGPDRWVFDYYYKGEGMLTLNGGEDQLLTRIEVNINQ